MVLMDYYTFPGTLIIPSSMVLSKSEAGCLGALQTAKTWRNRYEQKPKIEYEMRVAKTGILHSASLYNLRQPKKFLIKMRGHACEICHKKRWQGKPIPLVFDHIDGSSKNGNIDNCRLVCGNCNMQLPTLASKNRGNGRHYRRLRYNEGKSS